MYQWIMSNKIILHDFILKFLSLSLNELEAPFIIIFKITLLWNVLLSWKNILLYDEMDIVSSAISMNL